MHLSDALSYTFVLILILMTSGCHGTGAMFEIKANIVPEGFCSSLFVTSVTRRPELTCAALCKNDPSCLAASVDGSGVCTLWNCSAPATNYAAIYQVYDYDECSQDSHLCNGNDICINEKRGYKCIGQCLATQIQNPRTGMCQDKLHYGHADLGSELPQLDAWSTASTIDLRSGPLNNSLITEFNFYIQNDRGTVRLGAVKQWTADTFLFLQWVSPPITNTDFNLGPNSVNIGEVEVEENTFLLFTWTGGSNVPYRSNTAGDNCIKPSTLLPGLNYTLGLNNRNYGYGVSYINL